MEEKNKGGRPTKDSEKRDHYITISLTEVEYNNVVKKATEVSLKPSVLAANFVVNGFIKSIFTAEEQEAKKQLIGMSNNLNQLVHLAHKFGIKSIQYEADKLLDEIDLILNKYKKDADKIK